MPLKPSEIFYSQDSIMNRFQCGKYIGATLDELCDGGCVIEQIPTISVDQMNGKWVTGDNRRLWVFRHLERLGKCPEDGVPVRYHGYINPSKFTTVNGGASIRVRRGSPGGRWYVKAAPPRRTAVAPPSVGSSVASFLSTPHAAFRRGTTGTSFLENRYFNTVVDTML
jgi:hypothetical protein